MPKTSLIQKILLLFLSFIIVLVTLEVGLRIGGYVFLKRQEWANQKNLQGKNILKIMCVGESTTAMGGRFSYPSQLQEILAERLPGQKTHVINKGVPMTNTGIIRKKIGGWLQEYHPDIVILMMGINDHNDVIPIDLRASQTFPLLKSLRIYKLYQWFRKNWIYRNRAVEAPQPKKLHWLDTMRAIREKQRIGAMIVQADEQGSRKMALQALAQIRELSKWVADNDELYEGYGRLILKHQWYGDLPEVIDYFVKRNYQHSWLHDYAERSCASPVIKKVIVNHLEERIQKTPNDWRLFEIEGACYAMAGDQVQAEKEFKEVNRLQRYLIDPVTQRNYLDILKKIEERHIPFILVQYPIRDVRILKTMLQSGLDIQHHIFVDNEETFKKAVEKEGYRALFIDRFAGDFGHCTPLGNHLLAENVAKAVIRMLGRKDAGEKILVRSRNQTK